MLASYGKESQIPELGAVGANMDAYRDMEARGAMHAVGAFSPELVGLATLLIYGLPHYSGRMVAAMESFFVMPSARRGGTGIKLLRAAEQRAAELGATALLVSAPVGSRLEKVLPRTGFRETNRIFLRVLK